MRIGFGDLEHGVRGAWRCSRRLSRFSCGVQLEERVGVKTQEWSKRRLCIAFNTSQDHVASARFTWGREAASSVITRFTLLGNLILSYLNGLEMGFPVENQSDERVRVLVSSHK